MQKSPDKPLHREFEVKNCWTCDKKVKKNGNGCCRVYKRIFKRRGQRRFEKELAEDIEPTLELPEDIFPFSGDEYENWLEYRFGSAVDDGWLDD